MLRHAIVVAAIAASTAPVLAHPKFIQVRVGSSFDTEPVSINSAGDVAGQYDEQVGGRHSFVRYADGTLVIFDGTKRDYGNWALAINDRREIMGHWYPGFREHSYLRLASGRVRQIEAPDTDYTYAFGINNKGMIVGNANRPDVGWYGYTRKPGGDYKLFQMPEGLNRFYARVINDKGTIAGVYYNDVDRCNFFIRNKAGAVTPFKVDGKRYACEVTAINSAGAVTGTMEAYEHLISFVRWPDGRIEIVKIDPNGTTTIRGINASGTIAGSFSDGTTGHGFLRTADGTVTAFDYPDAFSTWATGINDSNVVVGSAHWGGSYVGFIRIP